MRGYRTAGGEVAVIGPANLGRTLMISLDWIALNVGRATGSRPASPAEAALGDRLVPGLLASIPAQLELARRADDILAI